MIVQLYILWDILIPITILSIVVSIIPFIIHIRLRNWAATFMTILLTLYGILTTANALINRTIPISYILNFSHTYWFCWIYDIGISTIKIACTGCYLRLLNRLLILLQKMATPQHQHQQQRHIYLPIDRNQQTTNGITHIVRRFVLAVSPSWDSSIVGTRWWQRHPWKIKLSRAKNTLELFYQDHHLLLWDIVFIWILPVIYMGLSTSVDIRYDENQELDSAIHYIFYSPSMGCLNRKTFGITASTIYYIYPLLLMCGGCIYTILIGIKMKQLKLYRRGKSTDTRLKRLPFYRLFIFCCLYNLFYVLHLPFIVPNYFTVVLHQRIPISERDMHLSKNGLILKDDKTFELSMVFIYPLLSFFWSLFFGTTQEAYSLYRSIWRWLKNCTHAWRGKGEESTKDDGQQQQQQLAMAMHEPLLPPPEIHLTATTTTISSYTSTLIATPISHSISSRMAPSHSPTHQCALSPSSSTPPKSRHLSSTSSFYDNYKHSLRSTSRRTLSFILNFPECDTIYYSAYSTINVDLSSETESSVTLFNQFNY